MPLSLFKLYQSNTVHITPLLYGIICVIKARVDPTYTSLELGWLVYFEFNLLHSDLIPSP